MSYVHLFPLLQSYAGYTSYACISYRKFPLFLGILRIIATISQEKCCYSTQDTFHNCRCTVILFPLLLCMLSLQSRTGFTSDPYWFFFVRSLLFPVCFSVANCAGYKFCILALCLPHRLQFYTGYRKISFPPLLLQSSAGCNRKQFPVAISRRKPLPFSQDTIVNLRRKHLITKIIKYKVIIQKTMPKKAENSLQNYFFLHFILQFYAGLWKLEYNTTRYSISAHFDNLKSRKSYRKS